MDGATARGRGRGGERRAHGDMPSIESARICWALV